MEEEERLESSLKEYQAQLQFVETALSEDSKNSDLLDLKSSLQEVVLLTRENLLSVKKQRLLCEVSGNKAGDNGNATESNSEMDKEFLKFQAELSDLNEGSSKDDAELDSLISELEGKKCRAPYVQEWGLLSHQNAIVMSVEMSSGQEVNKLEDLKVRVLFCNPLCDRMKPCPYYLDGECRFAEESCKFSHGYLVKLTELQEFKDPDYSTLEQGSVCLAKYSDGLWYQATIEECLQDHMFSVKYSKYNDTTTLKIEDLLPIGDGGESSSSDDDEDDDTSALMISDDDEADDVPSVVWLAMNSSQQPLGEWEKHTRGIASKLMEKMGYVWGQGLGRNGDGRLDPIKAVIFPQGKSLDKCMELREKGAIKDPETRQKQLKQKIEQGKIASAKNAKKKNVFDFLNSKLGHQKGKQSNSTGSKSMDVGETRKAETSQLKERSNRALNIGSLQLNEEMKRAERELERLHKSLTRNKERDRVMTSQIESRISEQKQLICSLKSQEKLIQSEQRSRKDHRKLSVF